MVQRYACEGGGGGGEGLVSGWEYGRMGLEEIVRDNEVLFAGCFGFVIMLMGECSVLDIILGVYMLKTGLRLMTAR